MAGSKFLSYMRKEVNVGREHIKVSMGWGARELGEGQNMSL